MALSAHIAAALRQGPQRIVVTGASGWLGRATVDLLHDALGDAFAQRVVCFGSRQADVRLSATRVIAQRPLSELGTLPRQPTLLLHFAFLTKDRAEAMPEADYCAANRAIRQTVLDALNPIGVEAVFVASSGAARHADDAAAAPAMRLYGMLKREDEDAFADWAQTHGTSAAIARIFNISGPHINKLNSYALSSFVLDALAGKPVVVRARHDVRRGYVAIRELMSLAFALLLERHSGVTRFDSGGQDIELGALAAMIAASTDGVIDRPSVRDGLADIYLGDDRSYRLLLDRHCIETVPLSDQIGETAAFLKSGSACDMSQDMYA
ncbi:NAD-dependent epimerase/dehydratase family protein [Novosphingobium lentum]|uniref:NAD-dependent epimerase/dehydratase family protein n=1 Tax=Novosphingobium lentum TaxID=145287 RepID=UPI000AE7B907|nr:NAD(P)-dependent oxidoreductase [Novosphingobium lentum]